MKVEMFRAAMNWKMHKPLFVRYHVCNKSWFLSIKIPFYWIRFWGEA